MDRLENALARSQRARTQVGVMFLDLDNFKWINDSLGHGAGDQLLLHVARLLQECFRASDTVGRLGGDEFIILLENEDESRARILAERVLRALDEPVFLEGRDVFVSFSIGIALSDQGAGTPEAMVSNADLAMYEAKRKGKGRFELFQSGLSDVASRRLGLESDLRRAIERDEFMLHFQPILDLQAGRLHGVEALVHWLHPEQGLISPLDFIPIAEESGLIVPLGEWVLRSACSHAKQWQARVGCPIRISVNLSARQFNQPDLTGKIAEILRENQLEPSLLTLELTEGAAMQEPAAAARMLQNLKDLGVQLAIDDFGTGYSSLAYLRNFPVDYLKIDRKFVTRLGQRPNDKILISSILAMAGALGLCAVAEGVETAGEAEELRALGCELAQGYHFSKPLAPVDLLIFLQNSAVLPAQSP